MIAANASAAPRRRVVVLVPLLAFLALAVLFYFRLCAGDPSRIPPALIGHPVPEVSLPPLEGLERDGKPLPGVTPETYKDRVSVLNVWASWCVPCRDEAPLLEALAQDKGIQIVGITYKDQPENARRFLGGYGVPESFVIGRDNRIRFKLVGPITPENLERVLKPEIEKALAAE